MKTLGQTITNRKAHANWRVTSYGGLDSRHAAINSRELTFGRFGRVNQMEQGASV